MSSFGAAQAASAYVPVPVISRETLHAGAVVKIKVPIGATDGAYPKDGEDVPFLQFNRTVRRGRVNFFVHTNDSGLRGKTITAAASVLKKTLADDRQFLYVDLVPMNDEAPVTHRLAVVMDNTPDSKERGDQMLFETPVPLEGTIIIAPLETPAESPAVAKRPSGDSQLDRLLREGWEIDSEDSASVRLFRMKGDQRKTLVHQRPKANGK